MLYVHPFSMHFRGSPRGGAGEEGFDVLLHPAFWWATSPLLPSQVFERDGHS